jgi:DNA repair exonuclease SbcCD nuclease subunit
MCAHRPDMMLLAGNLFDSNRAATPEIHWAMETLGRLAMPVVMIPGNHDCLDGEAIFRRHDFNRIPNVTLLTAEEGEIVRLPELGVAAWGRGMVEHCPANRPLAGCPDRPDDCDWYLGLAHGLFVPEGSFAHYGRSSPIHMQEIDACACDYLALGHHHVAIDLTSAAAAYSGSATDRGSPGPTYVVLDLQRSAPPVWALHSVEQVS